MSKSLTTDAYIIRHNDVRDFDRIYTLFTYELGKIRVLAKGVRRPTSKRNPLLQTANVVRVQLYQGGDYYVMQEAQLQISNDVLVRSTILTAFLYHLMELVDVLLPEEEPHKDVFRLLTDTFDQLIREPRHLVLRAFEIKLLDILGYLPEENSVFIGQLDAARRSLLGTLQEISIHQLGELSVDARDNEALLEFLHQHIERISEKRLRSLSFFSS